VLSWFVGLCVGERSCESTVYADWPSSQLGRRDIFEVMSEGFSITLKYPCVCCVVGKHKNCLSTRPARWMMTKPMDGWCNAERASF